MVDGIQELVDVLQPNTAEPSKTYHAEVSSIDNEGRVWVYLEGSTMETPTTMSSSEVAVGDNVNVEWRNNKLYIAGNVSNPSAGSIRVTAVEQATQVAQQAAQNAVADAGIARSAAEQAQATANAVEGIAVRAETSAQDAQKSADNAKESASIAINQLGIVENIVGVLDLISKNGNYAPTTDTEVQPDKWYFVRSGSGTEADPYVYNVTEVQTVYTLTEDTEVIQGKTYYTRSGTAPNYTYTPVENPVTADIGTYYEAIRNPSDQNLYELTGIQESIQNYVSSHMALDANGLWVQLDRSSTRILLSPEDGVVMYDMNGYRVGQYGQTALVGDERGFHIQIDGQRLSFFNGENEIAYMSGQKLYIPQSVVLQQMDVGLPYGHVDAQGNQDGYGQWSWKLHLNGETPPRNNLNLKWIG